MNTDTATSIPIKIEIDYPHLARLIARELRDTAIAETPHYPAGALIEVAEIRQLLGRRGRPMAPATFQKNFIENGLLTIQPGPNRAKRYVYRHEWEAIFNQSTRIK
jgi:hypothetical protein